MTRTHHPVEAPAHYIEGRVIEPIDVIEDWQLGFHLGNALKYLARAGRKDPAKTREDLAKAAWYIERKLETLDQADDADELLRPDLGADTVPFEVDWDYDPDLPYDDPIFDAYQHPDAIALQQKYRKQDEPDLGTVNFGSDEDDYLDLPVHPSEIASVVHKDGRYTGYTRDGKTIPLSEGQGGALYEDILMFQEWAEDDPWEGL